MAKETECARDLENKEIKIYTRKKRRNVLLKKRNQLSTEKNLQNEIEKYSLVWKNCKHWAKEVYNEIKRKY